jgi:hypothetical protein
MFRAPSKRRIHPLLTITKGIRVTGNFAGLAQGLIKVDGTFA